MKKLKGALRIYGTQDLLMLLFMVILVVGHIFYQYFNTPNDTLVHSFVGEYINFICYIIIFDYGFSFSVRYVMHSHFSSSRKLFYKALVTSAFLKSIVAALCSTIIIIYEVLFCRLNRYEYIIEKLQIKITHINSIEMLKFFIMLLIMFSFMWSISILFSSIPRFQFLFLVLGLISTQTTSTIFFRVLGDTSASKILIIIFIIMTLINLGLSWVIIRKKSNIKDSWFVKLSKSLSPNGDF